MLDRLKTTVKSSSLRKARWRKRQREGRMAVLVDIDSVAVPEALVALQVLDPACTDSHREVGNALSRLVAAIAEKVTGVHA